MMKLLVAGILLWGLTAAVQQRDAGLVSGIVRDSDGEPRPDVRVAAMAVPDGASGADVLVSIGRTDDAGRYSLEVPPGRYYILAGRLDQPTYYPSAAEKQGAVSLQVMPGATQTGLDITASFESLVVPQSTPFRLPSDGRTLLAFLEGVSYNRNGNRPAKFAFALDSVSGRLVSFITLTGSLSYACPDCSFFVSERGIGFQTSNPGFLFKLSADGKRLGLTCHAALCHVAEITGGRLTVLDLKGSQMASVPTSSLAAFAVAP